MNQPRRLQVLQAIVEDYVHSREPVGSKALIERHNLGVSSATIRNDMAALEAEGLIRAPHASAGRIPTDSGYRLFVDQIAAVQPLSGAERRAIQTLLDSADDTDEMLSRSVRLLASLTHQVAVLQYPVERSATVRHVELVSLSDALVLVILISSTGQVSQRNLVYPHSEQELADARAAVLAACVGVTLSRLASAPGEGASELTQQVLLTLDALAAQGESSRVLIAGTSYLAESTVDFRRSIGPVLEALEEQVVLLKLLTDTDRDERGFAVRIGAENQDDSLSETAVVAQGYGPQEAATVGVVGPTRMDYSGTMSKVNAVARYLSKILNESPTR